MDTKKPEASLTSALVSMANIKNNPTRAEVGQRSLDKLSSMKLLTDENIAGKMKAFIESGQENATSDIERITFVELLDIIEREGVTA